MTDQTEEGKLILEMCASLCEQCERELENYGDIDVSAQDCGCYCHFRGLGGAENKCAAGTIWGALYEAKTAIKRRELNDDRPQTESD